MRSYNQNI